MFDMISIFLNLLRLFLCAIMWCIFGNVPCAFEKNVYFASLGWKALYISVKSISSRALFDDTIFLLTFCWKDMSIFDSGVLKSPTTIVLLLISFLKSPKIFFMYLGTPMLEAYIFTMFMSSWWILPLSIMKWPSGSLYGPFFQVSFVWYEYCYPAFFPCPFAWKICFQPFSFSLCRSFVLRWVSCRQHMCGLCFLIHSAILCLFIGALYHLHLRLLSIGIYSFPILCTSVLLSFSLFLPFLIATPLVSLAELVWWRYVLFFFSFYGVYSFILK